MVKNEDYLIKNYLANLNTNVLVAGFNKVANDWREMDYTPEYSKFYFILSGEGWLRIGEKEFFPKPGQLFLMPQGIRQSYSVISENVYTKYWCHFTAKIRDINLFDILHFPYFIDVKDSSALESIFAELIKNFNSTDPYAPLMLQSCILRLLSFFMSNSTPGSINLSKIDKMEKLNDVLLYIENNFQNNINIEELARIAHLHPNYFIRLFKKHIGTSPIHYLNKKRVEEAKKLLTHTNLTLKEISEKIGMNDTYYLSRVFKEHTGFAPSDYRQLF